MTVTYKTKRKKWKNMNLNCEMCVGRSAPTQQKVSDVCCPSADLALTLNRSPQRFSKRGTSSKYLAGSQNIQWQKIMLMNLERHLQHISDLSCSTLKSLEFKALLNLEISVFLRACEAQIRSSSPLRGKNLSDIPTSSFWRLWPTPWIWPFKCLDYLRWNIDSRVNKSW